MWLSQVFFHSWTYSWQRAPPVGRLCHFPASPNRKKKNTEGGNAPERRTALRDRPHCGVSAFIITTYCTGLEDRSRGRWWSYGLSCVDAGGQRVRREGHGVGQGDGTLQQGLDLKDSSRLKLIETPFVAFGVFHLKTLSLSLCLFFSLSLSHSITISPSFSRSLHCPQSQTQTLSLTKQTTTNLVRTSSSDLDDNKTRKMPKYKNVFTRMTFYLMLL